MGVELDKPDSNWKNFQLHIYPSALGSGQQPVETCTRISEVFRGISMI